MVLNDTRATHTYSMDVTRTVYVSTSMGAMVDMILAAARTVQGGKLKNLIFTAHGTPGYFQLGAGLSEATMAPFAGIKGKVFKIWFRGCLVARIMDSQTAHQGDGSALSAYGITFGNGHEFCTKFAKLTGCYIVAPTEMQSSNRQSYSHGVMDSYEGLVLSYDPQGEISWQRRYPSLYGYNLQGRTAHLPNRE
jgi:hypothetical protein